MLLSVNNSGNSTRCMAPKYGESLTFDIEHKPDRVLVDL